MTKASAYLCKYAAIATSVGDFGEFGEKSALYYRASA